MLRNALLANYSIFALRKCANELALFFMDVAILIGFISL